MEKIRERERGMDNKDELQVGQRTIKHGQWQWLRW